jgi:CTP synthase
VRVCVIGDFDAANPAHAELEPALLRAAPPGAALEVAWVSPGAISEDGVLKHLSEADAIVGAPGPIEDVDGYLDAVEFAREGEAPYLGVELGLELAVVEFARTVLVMPRAHSVEFDDAKAGAVVTLLEAPPVAPGRRPALTGDLAVKFTKEGRLGGIYGAPTAVEPHRTAYGVPAAVRNQLFRAGMKTSATDETGFLVRALEHGEHPFFVLVSFVPQLGPAAAGTHPLFRAFLSAV